MKNYSSKFIFIFSLTIATLSAMEPDDKIKELVSQKNLIAIAKAASKSKNLVLKMADGSSLTYLPDYTQSRTNKTHVLKEVTPHHEKSSTTPTKNGPQ